MNKHSHPIPLRPVASSSGRSFAPPARSLVRAVVAHVKARARGDDPLSVARQLYRDDEGAFAVIQRAAASPASTTGWGAEVAGKALLDFALNLPGSAASKLYAAGLAVDMAGRNEVKIPRLGSGLPTVTFVDEGQPAPAVVLQFADTAMPAPSKMMLLTGFTAELAASAAAEAIIGNVLRAAAGRSLDAALFSTTAASTARPAGLLAGLTPQTPVAGGAQESAVKDLANLAGAIAGNGATSIAIVAGPKAAASLELRLPDLKWPVWASPALADTTVVALDPSNFITGFSPDPRIESSKEATIHYEDSAPLPIGTAGSPNVVAAPTRSAFQTDTIVLRLTLETSWTMRETGRVAVVNSVTWT